jgi:maleylpyruvate isomerase
VDARRRQRQVDGVVASHRGLESMLDDLVARGELVVGMPSRLPGWTVGHVLTHLARNADSMTRALAAAERGETVERYAGGATGRAAEIDAGAARRDVEQVADVHVTDGRLDAAFVAHSRWDGHCVEPTGRTIRVAELVFLRWREVEVHRFDLGVGYGPDDWPDEYVRTELVGLEMQWKARRPMGLTALPPAALAVPDRHRLAWLLGRAEIDGLGPAGVL